MSPHADSHPDQARAEGRRLAVVYQRAHYVEFRPCEMSTVRWLRLSEALARAGFDVDIVIDAERTPPTAEPSLRWVSPHDAVWADYDVVLALFHRGFETVQYHGASEHPFIITELGSVMGPSDETPGVYFFGDVREHFYTIQEEVARACRGIGLLTAENHRLWTRCHGTAHDVRIIPTGVPARIPAPGRDPYPRRGRPVVLYLGSIYGGTQREANRYWQHRLSELGRVLTSRGIDLYFVGPGDTDELDPEAVRCVGPVPHDESWDYQHFADVGLVLAQGATQDNESSKLYNYLRVGLPFVSEEPVPNNHLISEAGLGLVAAFEDPEQMADGVELAAERRWNRRAAQRYMVDHHTWDHRAATYRTWILGALDRGPGTRTATTAIR